MSDPFQLSLGGAPFGASPSFVDLLRAEHPGTVPVARGEGSPFPVPHGTTILGLKFAEGMVMAGDGRATSGYLIADAKIRKVFAADTLREASTFGRAVAPNPAS